MRLREKNRKHHPVFGHSSMRWVRAITVAILGFGGPLILMFAGLGIALLVLCAGTAIFSIADPQSTQQFLRENSTSDEGFPFVSGAFATMFSKTVIATANAATGTGSTVYTDSHDVKNHFTTVSRVRPRFDAQVSASSEGQVILWKVDIGDVVTQGEPLLEIKDKAHLRAQLPLKELNYAMAKSKLDSFLALASRDMVPSQSRLDYEYAFAQAKVELDILRQDIADLTVMAPFSGIVEKRLVEVGESVSQDTPVARLVSNNELIIRTNHGRSTCIDLSACSIYITTHNGDEEIISGPFPVSSEVRDDRGDNSWDLVSYATNEQFPFRQATGIYTSKIVEAVSQ